MYYYESHMGGFYSTNHMQSYEEIYCEQCGDSDHFLGQADTAEDTLQLLYKSANEEEYKESNILSVMEQLEEDFSIPETVILLIKDNNTGNLFINTEPRGHQFGTAHEALSCPALNRTWHEDILRELTKIAINQTNIEISKPKLLRTIKTNHTTQYIYESTTENHPDPQSCSYGYKDGWWGWSKEIKEPLLSILQTKEVLP